METQTLARLIDRKAQLLALVRRISEQQLALVGGGDLTLLVKLLAAKQTVLNELQALEPQLDPFRREDPDQRVWPSAADRVRCQQQVSHCETLLAEILVLEQQAERTMTRRRDQTAERLQGLQGAALASRAYLQTPAAAAGLDLASET